MSESEILKLTTIYRVIPNLILVDGKPDYRNAKLMKVFINHGDVCDHFLEKVRAFVNSSNGGSLLIEKKFTKRRS